MSPLGRTEAPIIWIFFIIGLELLVRLLLIRLIRSSAVRSLRISNRTWFRILTIISRSSSLPITGVPGVLDRSANIKGGTTSDAVAAAAR
jgi:hypothetical protein